MPTVTLYRPVGAAELALIEASGMRRFPPRLPEQPIFYPVLNERYAAEIAQRWNAHDPASGWVGHVLRFEVDADFLAGWQPQTVGASHHQEYWIEAEALERFNDAIVGPIERVAVFSSP